MASHAEPLHRMRWLAWGAIVALAAVAGITYALTRSHSSASGDTTTPPIATWAAGARPAPGFNLRDQQGKPVSIAQFHGKPVIVTFIDPLCRNFCPLEAKQLNLVVNSLPVDARPAVVAVSVNIYGNARANLLQDVAHWQLGSEWRWGVGSPAQLARVWQNYGVGVLVTTKKINGVTVHDVTHTEGAYLIDGTGHERALFLWPYTAADV
ncbi:MAG TPA: SCO family protein, partial [Gaiellaceae bacterium]|nr:SCO family protein [Gaiellaceae bacterium]